MTKPWNDDPAGLYTNVPALRPVDIGTAKNPLGTVYAQNIVADGLVGDETLPNDTFLNALDSTGLDTVGLLKLSAGGDTVINASSQNIIDFRFDDVDAGAIAPTGTFFPAYFLEDGALLNHSLTSFASGTAYSLTNSSAQLVFGTSNAQIALDKAGTYLLLARVNLEYAGATFAANQAVTLKLRRTNNTAADVTGSSTALGTRVVTTQTGIMASASLPPVLYTTPRTNDIITIFGDVAVAPSAGALNATEANIVAIRISA